MRWHVAIAALVTATIAIVTCMTNRPEPPRIGRGPGPPCELPTHACDRATTDCSELVEIPMVGSGYVDIRLDGEQTPATSTSYLRRDLMMVVRYAAAKVACKAADWNTGNGGLIALGDMSERDGATPGTLAGTPRHPIRTHVNGLDIDIAYFQRNTLDNQLRPICRHRSKAGVDAYRCLTPPERLDAWRTALFLGALLEGDHIRVIGVDGVAARPILAAFDELCRTNWIEHAACAKRHRIQYETSNTGRGWFRGHHNHLHVSWLP